MSRLKELREQNGITQKRLADITRISLRTLQKYETGERDIAKADVSNVIAISNALGVTVYDLVEHKTDVFDKILDDTINSLTEKLSIIKELDDIAKVSAARANKEIQDMHRKLGYAVGLLEAANMLYNSSQDKCDRLRKLVYDYDLLNAITNVY